MVFKHRAYFLLVLMSLVLAEAFPGDKHRSKYENVDIEALCENDRLMLNYMKCILDEGPCTAEGRDLKESIPSALENHCSDCDEADKERVRKGVNCVRCKYEEYWEKIVEHFDPEKKYRDLGVEFFGEKSC